MILFVCTGEMSLSPTSKDERDRGIRERSNEKNCRDRRVERGAIYRYQLCWKMENARMRETYINEENRSLSITCYIHMYMHGGICVRGPHT